MPWQLQACSSRDVGIGIGQDASLSQPEAAVLEDQLI